jgi:hypothetical protein
LRGRLTNLIGPEFNDIAIELADERAQVHARGESTEDVDWAPIVERVITAHGGSVCLASPQCPPCMTPPPGTATQADTTTHADTTTQAGTATQAGTTTQAAATTPEAQVNQ